jgi:tRNA/tmRNA/rRNA uracil-C5-methylase (TrmA/RlmC/RlmD family)
MTDATPLKIGDERVVTIGPIAHGGHFIAHSDGRTLFVRHAITGESVRVRITDVNSKMVRADAIEVLEPSHERVAAPCTWAHAGGCGGCDFQHIALAAQRRMKQEVLTDALRRFGRLSDGDLAGLDLTVHELPGHPDGLHWRSRVTWANDADGNVGLRRHHSHDIVAVDRCLIAADGVDLPGASPAGKVVHTVRDRTWRMDRDGFWQVHEALPEALVAAVLELGQPAPGQTWWDLYAGAGLFAAFLAEAVGAEGHVAAVESAESAIKSARRALHDLPQVALHHSDVTRWLREIDHDAPDGIVLDPPRSGVGAEVVAIVTAAEVPTIVYVACDPVALARDTASFTAAGYRLSRIRAFDAFPMTHHLETVALFQIAGL